MNRRKLSLKLHEWPAEDRRAMEAALGSGQDLFDTMGLGSRWRPATKAKVIKSYGMLLHCLGRHGALDALASPRDRVSRNHIVLLDSDMRNRGVASETRASVFRDIREALRIMHPVGTFDDLNSASRTLDRRAVPSRDQRHLLVAPADLFDAGIRRMDRLKELATVHKEAGVQFGDGLMIGIEAGKALRLRNLAGMLSEHNIHRNQLDEYEVRYEPHETKTRARIRAPLPEGLAPYLDHWLKVVRPNLLEGRESQAMWITTHNTDMAPITLYYRFCRATKEETGRRINPHLVRKIIVTGLAIGAPELIELAPAALDHVSSRHTRDAYDLADDLAASRVANRLVGHRRAEAIRRLKP